MIARTTRPKLSLTVPTITSPTIPSAAPKSPFPASLNAVVTSPLPLSPCSPTARNTIINSRREFSSSPAPKIVNRGTTGNGGILKKAGCACTRAEGGKKISFSREARVNVVSPMPADYHGSYRRMDKDEVRWGLRSE